MSVNKLKASSTDSTDRFKTDRFQTCIYYFFGYLSGGQQALKDNIKHYHLMKLWWQIGEFEENSYDLKGTGHVTNEDR